MNKREVGAAYEALALFYLEQRGYRILETNYRCRTGEIDIIAREGRYLVFLEVRYRSTRAKGSSLESVNHRKQAVIVRTAKQYLRERRLGEETPCRFDVVGIDGEEVQVIQNAF